MNMDLATFIAQVITPSNFFKYPVVLFSGSEYSRNFFVRLLQLVRAQLGSHFQSCDTLQTSSSQLALQLSVQFLDNKILYWLGDFEQHEEKKNIIRMLESYQAPHSIWFYGARISEQPSWCVVTLPDIVDQAMAVLLYVTLFGPATDSKKKLLHTLFTQQSRISLEQGCLLMHYAMLMSTTQEKEFMRDWFHQLIPSEHSLFAMSSYFFAHNKTEFFIAWQSVQTHYPIPFWISFWSELFFKAAHFIKFIEQRDFVQAKQIAHRLPFSFIKKDWQSYDVAQLIKLHDDICDFDYRFKQGASQYGLDVLYIKFFAGHYKKKL